MLALVFMAMIAVTPTILRVLAHIERPEAAMKADESLTLRGHKGAVTSVAFSLDGKRIASGSADETVKIWDAKTGRELLTFRGHNGLVWSVAFSPDGKRIVSSAGLPHRADDVRVWDAASGRQLLTLRGLDDVAVCVAFSPDGKRIAGSGVAKNKDTDDKPESGQIKVWDARSGRELLTLKGHTGVVWSVAFNSDGTRIVSGSGGFDASVPGQVKVWGCSDG